MMCTCPAKLVLTKVCVCVCVCAEPVKVMRKSTTIIRSTLNASANDIMEISSKYKR